MAAIGKSDKTALQLEISLLATLIENVTNTLSTVEDFYTGRPEADIPPENMWLEKLVDTSANGIDKALTNMDAKAFYMLTVDRIATKKLSADISMRPLRAHKSRPRLGIGGRGPKTEFMKQQVSALTHHLKKHSFKPTEGNIYAQALQCWLLNREEWDVARNARGQNKGYSSPKTLAAAWLNKKDNNRLS